MMSVAIHRLNEGERATLGAHFLALPMNDRWLRFGTPLGPPAIAAYVDRIDFDHDAVFGVHDDRLALVGVAHVACENDLAELGLSVLPAHRCQGVGGALFKRAVAYSRNRCIPRLLMRFLSGNAPIMRIAKRSGMNIVARAGEACAHLKLPPASLASIIGEFGTDTFALYDGALKALVAAWKHQRRARRQSASVGDQTTL